MPVNLDKPQRWQDDVAASVKLYNAWYMAFAPEAFRRARQNTAETVLGDLIHTRYLSDLSPSTLKQRPGVVRVLRMCTAPPMALDRLVGLSGVSKSLVQTMESSGTAAPKLPLRMATADLDDQLERLAAVIRRLTDGSIFPWVPEGTAPTEDQVQRAATVVADRLCGALADPIIRNAQETRQLAIIQDWLTARGYTPLPAGLTFRQMPAGTFSFRLNVPVEQPETGKAINLPVDAVIQPHSTQAGDFPLLIEAKSAGDFTNTNKRRKEEAQKYAQLRAKYGPEVRFVLFLCGYFDVGYLSYEAAEGIDWVWEHRPDDMTHLGL